MSQGNASHARPRLLLRPEDAAEILSVSRTTLFGLLQSGAIRSVKIGGLRRIPFEALQEFVIRLSCDTGAGTGPTTYDEAGPDGTGDGRAGRHEAQGRLAPWGGSDPRPGIRSTPERSEGQASKRPGELAP